MHSGIAAALSALFVIGAGPSGHRFAGAAPRACASLAMHACERTATPRDVAPPIDTLDQPTPIRPDSAMTPGAALDVTAVDVCTPGFASRIRHVTAQTKRKVYAAYGITAHGPGDYEVDHLISLELGGSNARTNLWPQSYHTQPWNARVKDALENRLHRMVCAHTIPLETAQQAIAIDWIAAYETYMPRRRRRRGG
jgi:hypothetical protein